MTTTETNDQTQQPEAPEAPATVPVIEYGGFSFGGLAFEESVPEAATKAPPRANELPFPAMFSAAEKTVIETGKKAPWFIPARFWKERAEATTEITGTYQREKLRGQFNKWKKASPEARAGFSLLLVARTGKEGITGIAEAGMSMWLAYEAPKAAEKEEEGEKAPNGEPDTPGAPEAPAAEPAPEPAAPAPKKEKAAAK